MRKIKKIVIHCSDSPDSLDLGRREIDQWHKERGWSGIGYHFVVRRSGVVELGRDLGKTGAHVKGHNTGSVGICWIGRTQPTQKQYKALVELSALLGSQYRVPFDEIYGHTELDPGKTCPNLDMDRFRAEILFADTVGDQVKEALNVALRSEDE